MIANRYNENPILLPSKGNSWESRAVFNGCPVVEWNKTHLFYRAMSASRYTAGVELEVSSIGHAVSKDGKTYTDRRQLIKPEYDWEKYGCEDPRVTKLDGKYYIFYTALSRYPFDAEGIRIGVATGTSLDNLEKHQVTTFNSKAMALFPEKVDGKMLAVLTADTDNPPSKIALAYFNEEKDIWSKRFWNAWYKNVEHHTINLEHRPEDHIELGAPPIKTKEGWLLIYSYIRDYFTDKKTTFEIQAVLLDLKDPSQVIGHTKVPLLIPEEVYEIYGMVPNIVFPSGAYVKKDELHIFYGASDTTCCAAKFKLQTILDNILNPIFSLERSEHNPLLVVNPKHDWESRCVFNPSAIYADGKFHIIYRAMSLRGESTIGYAVSEDGMKIDEVLDEPIYRPRKDFERKDGEGYSGCEDPRLVQVDDVLYMFYTGYDGYNPPSVVLTSIKMSDFLNRNWVWSEPLLISPLNEFNKNACIFPEKFGDKYAVLYRINNSIDFNYIDNLHPSEEDLAHQTNWIMPRPGRWDSLKIGITGAPIKLKEGWLLIYHGVSQSDHHYRLGAILLDLDDPQKVIARTDAPILEPLMDYEKVGEVNNVVFSCGAAIKGDDLFVYYGGADQVVAVAKTKVKDLLLELKKYTY
jgi:predicted GH43/DUF377 family glycosyl hydrolase